MRTKTWIALLALYIVWGSTFLAIRFTVETIPPFLSAGLRFLTAGIILMAWRRSAGDPMPTPRQWRSLAIIGTLMLLGGNGLVSFAEQRIASGVAALIIGTDPLWLVLIEALRPGGVRPNWKTVIGLLVGFGGIYLLVGPSNQTGGLPFDAIGTFAVIMASFIWSLGSIYMRSADVPSSTLMMTAGEMLAGSIPLFAVSALTGELNGFNPAEVTTKSWLGLGYLIAFGSLIAFVAYGWLIRNAPVSLVGTYGYVNPLVAILLGALLADEILTGRILVAAAIIIGSVVIINSSHKSKAARPAPEAEPGAAD